MILQIRNINGKILRKSIPLDERTAVNDSLSKCWFDHILLIFQVLDLRGNPLTSMLRYREHVIGSCCYLNMVDGKSIEPRSRIMMVNLHKMRLRKNLMSLIPSMDLCGSKGFKVTSCQSWRFEKKSVAWIWVPDDWIILKVWWTVTLQPFDL